MLLVSLVLVVLVLSRLGALELVRSVEVELVVRVVLELVGSDELVCIACLVPCEPVSPSSA